jgi:C4-dicarboxylate-specific signal transduction histidine kinase
MIVLFRKRGNTILHIRPSGYGARPSPGRGDRVQLQQVLVNLVIRSIDAMKEVNGTRELAIKSQRAENMR